ncbi:PrsW family intramembrane metalloprotease [Candidatus Micrarchaeota archaeon]|nr:PrsW family intramembrane metalloprotease [Candidatus Micrarchaeota archaeon]
MSVVLLYIAIHGTVWKSEPALLGFVFSGLMAFIIPFLWCAAWWYADFREREPLRIILTFFFWGMFAALMAIGINSISDDFFTVFGFGAIGLFIVPPIIEEFFKGSGLAFLCNHHEYDSVEDGVVFGFAIGMGFSFVENWLYLMGAPLGSSILAWVFLFILRSIVFSVIHGFYTAISGAVIGYLKEKQFGAPALGLLLGLPIAAVFHAIHNSGAALGDLAGGGGTILYCCFLVPVFDFGGFIILIILFVRALLRQKQ